MKVRRAIGIDIGPSHLCAVQVSRIGKALCIERIFGTQIRRSTDSLSEIVRALVRKHGFSRRAPVAVSMPEEAVFFRTLDTDNAELEQMRASGLLGLDYDFPIEPDQTVAGIGSYRRSTAEKVSVLTAAVSKESLTDLLNVVRNARMRPHLIDVADFAIYAAAEQNHPGIKTGRAILVYIATSYVVLMVTEGRDILMVRHLPIVAGSGESVEADAQRMADVLSSEAEIVWERLFDEGLEYNTRVYLGGNGSASAALKTAIEENLQCQTTVVNPLAKMLLKDIHRVSSDILVAEGLAIRALMPDETAGVNFLEAEPAGVKPVLNVKKQVAVCTVLGAAIIVVSLIGLFLRFHRLENQYTAVKSEMKDVFQRTLPDEKNIVNPLAQLEQRLQALRKDYAAFGPIAGTSAGPLDVLQIIAVNTPMELKISLDDVQVTAQSVRLAGTSDSFESVYDWQDLLADALHSSTVDVRDVRREPDSKTVRFVLLASVSGEKTT
jgi:Tfp pilus assembly PilM family ATPase